MTDENQQSPGSLIADEFYAAPTEDTQTEDVSTQNEDEPTQGASAQTETQDAGTTDDGATESDHQEEVGEEEVEITTVEQLAEHFQFDPDWMSELTIQQKVNGKEISVNLGEALSTHRKITASDEVLATAKEKAKSITDAAKVEQEQLTQHIAGFANLIKSVEAEIERDQQTIDPNLRKDDPAEWAARNEEIKQRKERLGEIKAQGVQQYQNFIQHGEAQTLAQLQADLPNQREILAQRLPEWKDETVSDKEQKELVTYLRNHGFEDRQIKNAAYSAETLSMAVKAMRYDSIQKGKEDAGKKRVFIVPKNMKPGGKAEETQPSKQPDDTVSLWYGSN